MNMVNEALVPETGETIGVFTLSNVFDSLNVEFC